MLKDKYESKFLDFNHSSIGWELKKGSVGLFKLDCKLKIKKTNQFYYLAKTVVAGNVYGKSTLPIIPNYNYQWAINGQKRIVFRNFKNKVIIDNKKDIRVKRFFKNISYKKKKEISINKIYSMNNFFNKSLICRLEIFDQICEFPINHINIHIKNKNFQIETGPIMLKKESGVISSAFLFFNSKYKCQVLWNYPKLGGKIEELNKKSKFYIDA